MAPRIQEIEAPDTLARTQATLGNLRETTEDMIGEKLIINMGPSHPATHGVLRIVLELDGELITRATPDVGYLHRGDEKIAENMQYNQFVPYTDRLDYLAPLANNVAYALAVEKLMGWELPPRGKAIRVICCEMARISAHLLGLGAFAMDTGAITVFMYTFAEREKIYNLTEQLTGARFTTSYTRVGGQIRDMSEVFITGLRQFLKEFVPALNEVDGLLTRNRIFVDRTRDVGVITREQAIASGCRDRTCAVPAWTMTCARRTRTWITRTTTSTSPWARSATATTAISCDSRKCARASGFWSRRSTGCRTARSTSWTVRTSCRPSRPYL